MGDTRDTQCDVEFGYHLTWSVQWVCEGDDDAGLNGSVDRYDELWHVGKQQPQNVTLSKPHSPEQSVRESTAESARLAVAVGSTAGPACLKQEVVVACHKQFVDSLIEPVVPTSHNFMPP